MSQRPITFSNSRRVAVPRICTGSGISSWGFKKALGSSYTCRNSGDKKGVGSKSFTVSGRLKRSAIKGKACVAEKESGPSALNFRAAAAYGNESNSRNCSRNLLKRSRVAGMRNPHPESDDPRRTTDLARPLKKQIMSDCSFERGAPNLPRSGATWQSVAVCDKPQIMRLTSNCTLLLTCHLAFRRREPLLKVRLGLIQG